MKNIKLTLQYDGSNYHGFQIQPSVETVQGVLERTVKEITGESVRVYGCSRTDAGVHAYRYVAGFKTDTPIPSEKISVVMNNYLPDDISILSSEEVDEEFHPRFSCLSKTYRYIIDTDETPDVFRRNYEWQIKKDLDVNAMKESCRYIIGEHDFRSFMTSGPDMESTVRRVYSLDVEKNDKKIVIYINADGYLYNMVRIITGTLCLAGEGKIAPSYMEEIINQKDRSFAGPTAPPQGLYLYKIFY